MNHLSSFRPHAGLLKKLPFSDACIIVTLLVVLIVQLGVALYTLNSVFTIEVPVRKGEIHEGVVGVPVHKNPLLASTVVEQDVASLLHAGLLRHDGTGNYIPHLADQLEQDNDSYTFRLKEGVRFHDGTALTTDDVLHTIAMVNRLGADNLYRVMWDGVSAEAVDSRVVRIVIPEGNLSFPRGFVTPILPRHIWRKIPDNQWHRYAGSGVYIGAGPYRHEHESLTIDGRLTRFTLEGFDDYVLGRPYIKQVHFHFFADTDALLEAFGNGRINAVHSITATEVSALLHHGKHNDVLYTADTNRAFGVFFNMQDGRILQDPFLRSVLSQLIDREVIVQQVFHNRASVLQAPIAADTELTDQTIGPEEIQQTLEDIGWRFENAENRRERSGTPLRISFVLSDTPEQKQIGDMLAAGWRQLGFEVEIRFLPQDVLQRVVAERQFDVLLHGYEADNPDDLVDLWESGDRENIAFITSFGSPVLNGLLDELKYITPPGRFSEGDNWREMVYTAIKQEMMKRVPAVFLYSPHFLYVLPIDIFGVSAEGRKLGRIHQPSDRFMNIHMWYTQKEQVWKFLSATH